MNIFVSLSIVRVADPGFFGAIRIRYFRLGSGDDFSEGFDLDPALFLSNQIKNHSEKGLFLLYLLLLLIRIATILITEYCLENKLRVNFD